MRFNWMNFVTCMLFSMCINELCNYLGISLVWSFIIYVAGASLFLPPIFEKPTGTSESNDTK